MVSELARQLIYTLVRIWIDNTNQSESTQQQGMSKTLPTPQAMIAYLNRFVRGQVRAKQDMAVAVYNHYLSQAYRDLDGEDLGRHHILLIGPTGSGKTFIVRTLAQMLDVPVAMTSATTLVEVGYKGSSVETVIVSLLIAPAVIPAKPKKVSCSSTRLIKFASRMLEA